MERMEQGGGGPEEAGFGGMGGGFPGVRGCVEGPALSCGVAAVTLMGACCTRQRFCLAAAHSGGVGPEPQAEAIGKLGNAAGQPMQGRLGCQRSIRLVPWLQPSLPHPLALRTLERTLLPRDPQQCVPRHGSPQRPSSTAQGR